MQKLPPAALSITMPPRYNDTVTAPLTQSLKQTEQDVAQAILRYRSLGSLSDNELAALTGLEKLQTELDDLLRQLQREHTLLFRHGTRHAFQGGIRQGIAALTTASLPFYADLQPTGIDKLATRVFTLVDRHALDFITRYTLTLAGDVSRELADGIKRGIMQGIISGKGTDAIVRDLGRVVLDKKSFRQAGTRVFSKAQYRWK